MALRVFSHGGGVQSTAAIVLAVQGKIDFPVFLFSNVGDDSEHPDTLTYFHEIAKPYAVTNGIELHELRHTRKDGREDTLYSTLTHPGTVGAMIPIFLERSGAPGMRACTSNYKARRIARWLRKHGATAADPAVCGMGISLDEFQRMRSESGFDTHTLAYPLIDLRLTRQDCVNIIEQAGLPVPPKSSCFFCPFHSIPTWQHLKRTSPELFDRSVALEKMLSDRSEALGRGKVFLRRQLRPLDQVIGDQMDMFDEDDGCESGYCMT